MRRATIRRSADGGLIEVRAGDKVLGQVTSLQSHSDTLMDGSFTHRPAYADVAPEVIKLARAVAAGDTAEEQALRGRLEGLGFQVWHTAHDMRIDRPQTLTIVDGKATFAPNDAFMMMRTGGLG